MILPVREGRNPRRTGGMLRAEGHIISAQERQVRRDRHVLTTEMVSKRPGYQYVIMDVIMMRSGLEIAFKAFWKARGSYHNDGNSGEPISAEAASGFVPPRRIPLRKVFFWAL